MAEASVSTEEKTMFKSRKFKHRAVGINIYGGGFTLGVMDHFNVLGQWEEINLGDRTFRKNFAGLEHPLNLSDWPVKQHKGIDFVYANPPCAPWSRANNRTGKTVESRFNDPRLALTNHSYAAAFAMQPTVFISESVEAAHSIGVEFYRQHAQRWLRAGYAVTFFLTDALLHGAPSQRRRFHFIAHRVALHLGDPPRLESPLTVRQAFNGLTDDNFGEIAQHDFRPACDHHVRLFKHVPPGGKLQELINRLPHYDGPRAGFFNRRLQWHTVAPTMVGFDLVHPDGHRWITHREALRLCTYPDDFIAHNPTEAVDAVLPAVGRFLAKVVKYSIIDGKPAERKLTTIDWRPLGRKFHIAVLRHGPVPYNPTHPELVKHYGRA